ncbi:MAG: hypothetical protein PUF31_03045 [Oscillospiraceae bacterium]|nr:hypothetical protein [Oscillospiraceae bacterium]
MLKANGIEPIFTQANCNIDTFISNHADVNFHHLGENRFLADISQQALIPIFDQIDAHITISEEAVSGKYPFDCRLNFARVGNKLFGKSTICGKELQEHCRTNGIDMINVNQGYGKCSVCVVNHKAIITDDVTIKKAADAAEMDCLLICKGDIRLNGHPYGFIGGASTLIDKNKLLFFGNLKQHTNYADIIRFCYAHNCEVVFDERFELIDIGGMIPVLEY